MVRDACLFEKKSCTAGRYFLDPVWLRISAVVRRDGDDGMTATCNSSNEYSVNRNWTKTLFTVTVSDFKSFPFNGLAKTSGLVNIFNYR